MVKSNGSFIFADGKLNFLRPLLHNKGLQEILLVKLSEEELSACHDDYIRLIAGLSVKFHGRLWWCNPVSEKNEHGSKLYQELVNYYALYKTLENAAGGLLLVACSPAQFSQLKSSDLAAKWEIRQLRPDRFSNFFQDTFSLAVFPVRIARLILKYWHRGWLSRALLRKKIDVWKTDKKIGYILRTWQDQRCLDERDRYIDPYFGKLPEYLQSKGFKVLILAGIYGAYNEIINRFKDEKTITLIAEEFFLGIKDCLKAAGQAVFKSPVIEKTLTFRSVRGELIIRRSLKEAYLSGAIFSNLLRYYIGRNLAKSINDFTYIQPFENYAWEKAMILGLKFWEKERPEVRIFGFQHAFICQDSFKYFPGREEEPLIPLPDRIVTLGDVTRRILSENGRYASIDLRSGCALRQEYLNVSELLPRGKLKIIMVPLTMVRSECLKIIDFLVEAKLKEKGYSVILRFHPLFGYEALKKDLPGGLPAGFSVNIDKTAVEAIGKADIVAYTWSTVAVEALRLGVPVVHLDILKPLRVDPLFQCPGLKYRVKEPRELAVTAEKIYGLSDEQFLKERYLSQEYLKEYFLPVDETHLRNFLP